MKKFVFAALALGMLAAVPARAQSDCLQVGRIWSFHPIDNRTLIVRDQLRRHFRVTLGHCPRLSSRLALRIRSNGMNRLACVRRGDMVVSGRVRCPVMSVKPAI